LRAADGSRNVVEVCQERNISEQTFHRWKRRFGVLEIPEARRRKERENENADRRKMLAESLGKNRARRSFRRKF
jgi:putative transposase